MQKQDRQPFNYPISQYFKEPDWQRLPGYKNVTTLEWESVLWQRQHTVKSLKELKEVFGDFIDDSLLKSIEQDQREMPTMPILVPPQMLNTMNELDLWHDPIRRYMLVAYDDRHPEWPESPEVRARLTARSRYVGCRGVNTPLSHKSSGRTPLYLSPVLRALYAHGSLWKMICLKSRRPVLR